MARHIDAMLLGDKLNLTKWKYSMTKFGGTYLNPITFFSDKYKNGDFRESKFWEQEHKSWVRLFTTSRIPVNVKFQEMAPLKHLIQNQTFC